MNTSRQKKQITLAELKGMMQIQKPKVKTEQVSGGKSPSRKSPKTEAAKDPKPTLSAKETEIQQEAVLRRQQRYQEAKLLLEFLCETHPQCFNFKFRKPLKIGIDKDILAKYPEKISSKAILAYTLKIYTLNIRYWKGILSQNIRVDLDGKPDGIVTAEQKSHANGPYQKALAALAERQAKAPKTEQKPKVAKIK